MESRKMTQVSQDQKGNAEKEMNSDKKDGKVLTRHYSSTWRRTTAYVFKITKVTLIVKTYVQAQNSIPIGPENLICYYTEEKEQLSWEKYDRVVIVGGARGLLPLAETLIGLHIDDKGTIYGGELLSSKAEYHFKLAEQSNARKIKMATTELREIIEQSSLDSLLRMCQEDFGFQGTLPTTSFSKRLQQGNTDGNQPGADNRPSTTSAQIINNYEMEELNTQPIKPNGSTTNATSLVLPLDYGKTPFIRMGDMDVMTDKGIAVHHITSSMSNGSDLKKNAYEVLTKLGLPGWNQIVTCEDIVVGSMTDVVWCLNAKGAIRLAPRPEGKYIRFRNNNEELYFVLCLTDLDVF